MKKWIAFTLLVFILGCQGSEPAKLVLPAGDGNHSESTPVNGQLDLPAEILKINAANSFDTNLDFNTKIMTKEYFFVTDSTEKSYVIQLIGFDKNHCDSISEPRFFLIASGAVYTQITSGAPFTLPASTNYRLQFYTEKMNCSRLKVSFTFKRM